MSKVLSGIIVVAGLTMLPAGLRLEAKAAEQAAQASPAAEAYLQVLAKVGDEIITSFDVEQALRVVEAGMSTAEIKSADGKKKLEEARQTILDRMIEEKLVVMAADKGPKEYQDAKTQGQAMPNPYLPTSLEVEEEMEKTFEDTRARFPTEEDFDAELKKERLTVPEFRNRLRDRVRRQLTFARMLNFKKKEFQAALKTDDEEARRFYDENRLQFAVGEQVQLRHLLLKKEDEALARQVMTELKAASAPKEKFIQMCRKYSRDAATREQGGRLGWIEKGQVRWPELDAVAFRLKVGQVSEPVRTSEGWHLLWVDEKKPGEQKSFEEVKNAVRNQMFQKKMEQKIQDWVQSLKEEIFVERK
jgi:hypothetical protein